MAYMLCRSVLGVQRAHFWKKITKLFHLEHFLLQNVENQLPNRFRCQSIALCGRIISVDEKSFFVEAVVYGVEVPGNPGRAGMATAVDSKIIN